MKLDLFFSTQNIMLLFLILIIFACNNSSLNNKANQDSIVNVAKSDQQRNDVLLSGQYGEMSIAVDSSNFVTGVYEYYDGWDEKYKEYTKVSKFYFSGPLKNNDSIVDIIVYWPHKQQNIQGSLKVSLSAKPVSVGLYLMDIPLGYAAIDFTNESIYRRSLNEQKNWIQIRIVKSDKCRLYDFPDLSNAKRVYIVKDDIVKVLNKSNGWLKVEYNSPNNTGKPILAWIQQADVFEIATAEPNIHDK